MIAARASAIVHARRTPANRPSRNAGYAHRGKGTTDPGFGFCHHSQLAETKYTLRGIKRDTTHEGNESDDS
jgi:hypothetical protein